MTASSNRMARLNRSHVNVAANRLTRDLDLFNLANSCVRRKLLQREAEAGRELLPGEVEAVCEAVGVDDLVAFIRTQHHGTTAP